MFRDGQGHKVQDLQKQPPRNTRFLNLAELKIRNRRECAKGTNSHEFAKEMVYVTGGRLFPKEIAGSTVTEAIWRMPYGA